MSRGMVRGANIDKISQYELSRSCLFILLKQNNDFSQAKCTVRVLTSFTSLVLAMRTSTVATASFKKGTVITSSHNLPLP